MRVQPKAGEVTPGLAAALSKGVGPRAVVSDAVMGASGRDIENTKKDTPKQAALCRRSDGPSIEESAANMSRPGHKKLCKTKTGSKCVVSKADKKAPSLTDEETGIDGPARPKDRKESAGPA